MYKIGDIVDLKEYTKCAIWCIQNNATLLELSGTEKRLFQIVAIEEQNGQDGNSVGDSDGG